MFAFSNITQLISRNQPNCLKFGFTVVVRYNSAMHLKYKLSKRGIMVLKDNEKDHLLLLRLEALSCK